MDGQELYALYSEELAMEGLDAEPWMTLPDGEKIAWQKLARRLPREFAPRQAMLSSQYPD